MKYLPTHKFFGIIIAKNRNIKLSHKMLKKSVKFLLLIAFSQFLFQCNNTEKKERDLSENNTGKDTAIVQPEIVEPEIVINYAPFVFPKKKKDSAMAVFVGRYSKEEQYTILALNRLDQKNRWRADTLIVPDKLDEDFLVYTPFPKQIKTLSEVKKMVFFSYKFHAFAAYENGILKKWGPSSLGKENTPTNKGLTFTNWKSELATSTVDPSWKLGWNFNIYNQDGIGWHQYDLPGYHASHSCLRLLEEDAKWLYSFADQWILDETGNKVLAKGTAVMVFGDAEFKTKPWRNLLKDKDANKISVELMDETIEPYISTILKEQKNSEELRSRREQVRAAIN